MATEIFGRLELNLPKQHFLEQPQAPKTPSEWFALKFPEAARKYGCPFLEMRQASCDGFVSIVPVSINSDFFAGMLGGDSSLGHSVVYFEPEMPFLLFRAFAESLQADQPGKAPELLSGYGVKVCAGIGRRGGQVEFVPRIQIGQNFKSRGSKGKVDIGCIELNISPQLHHTRESAAQNCMND